MNAELHGRTQRRAYELWEREGRPEGRADEHWSRAEAEILAEAADPGPGGEAAPDPEPGGDEPPKARPGSRGTRGRRRQGSGSRTERSPSDLAADEAAKGGGGVGP